MLPKSILTVLAAAALFAGPPEALVVHEWGTFTSVADEDGSAMGWTLLAPGPDLPCFVYRIDGLGPKIAYSTVRMETPVLYFYAAHAVNVAVSVAFPEGLISEWYPRASSVAPRPPIQGFQKGAIEWRQVSVSPEDKSDFLVEPGPSHYYAARNTDSAPIRVGDQHEKLLFYRGVGNFEVPVRARVSSGDVVDVSKTGADPIPFAMLFDNRGGNIGYRRLGRIDSAAAAQMPELTGDRWVMQQELERAMVELGLYPREAHAMLETWQDSWFEEGTRIIYIMPRPAVDAILPLKVTPSPASVARVFAGRVEILSPWVRAEIVTALESETQPNWRSAAGSWMRSCARSARVARIWCNRALRSPICRRRK